MDNKQFTSELEQLLKYINTYATDFYNLSSFRDIKKIKSIGKTNFLNKCHEGFKLAQEKIVNNILFVENELIIICEEHKQFIKNKHKKDLKKDLNFIKICTDINFLKTQISTFKEVANMIAWTIIGFQRTTVKSFIQKDGNSGYLKDKDIKSSIEIAKEINKNENEFALICDITSVLNLGDLLVKRKGHFEIIEIKQDGKINNIILDILNSDDHKKNEESVKILHSESKKHGIKNLLRVIRQYKRALNLIQYIEKEEAYDYNFNMPKKAINIITPEKNNCKLLNKNLEYLYENKKEEIIFLMDCLIVRICRLDARGNGLSNQLNFKHHIYHIIKKPWEECQYGNIKENDIDNNFIPELAYYMKYQIYSLKDSIHILSHKPLFSLLKDKYSIDLLTDIISIDFYFDVNIFLDKCKKYKLRIAAVDRKSAKHILKSIDERSIPFFNNKLLVYDQGEQKLIFSKGLFFRLVYELQTSESLIKQIKEQFLISESPRLYKLFKLKKDIIVS
ncbi:MAG: hypothetical protein WC735_04585 [Candidatus Paceibacterota bacterium]|jgi:hypothetical protein